MIKNIKKYILYILIQIIACYSFSQEHIKFRIDEGELDNIDVFSMINDKNGNLIVATSDGLYKYNGFQINKINSNHLTINSLFGLIKDNNESIFFYNLKGDIYKLVNDSIVSFCSVPDSCLSSNLTIAFDNSNNLIVCSKNYYVLKNNKFIKIANNNSYAREIINLPNKYVVLYDPKLKAILFYSDNKIIKKPINLKTENINFSYLNFFKIENQIFLTAQNDKSKFLFKVDTTLTPNLQLIKEFNDNNTLLSIVSNNKGDFSSIENGFSYFVHFKDSVLQSYSSDYRISRLFFDNQDNLLIGTFGKGLYKVFSLKSKKINFTHDISALTKGKNNTAFVATENGNIYELKENKKNKILSHKRLVDNLIYIDDKLFFNNKYLIELKNKLQSKVLLNIPHVNDYTHYKNGNIILATSSGIYKLDTVNYNLICLFNKNRYNSVFVKNDSLLIASRGNQIDFFIINNNSIVLKSSKSVNLPYNYLNIKDNIFYSEDNKLFKINDKNDTTLLFKFYKPIRGLNQFNNSIIGINTNNYLILYDIESNSLINTFKLYDANDKITHVNIINEYIILVSRNNLYLIYLKDLLNKNKTVITDKITDYLKINNKKYSAKELFNNSFNILLKSGKYNIEIYLKKLPVENHEGWQYEYFVEDFSNKWKNVNDNKISFFTENHGEYKIKYRAKNIAGITSPINNLNIVIKKPFYLEWWFVLISILTIIIVFAIIYYNKLKNINKKLLLENRVKTSEIVAIKAQMNPHFIFNTLNSVQDLIFLKDKRSTNIYLGKFADLMRKILDNSEKLEIPLNEEIEILKLYIDLEELRFENEIEIDFKVDVPDSKMDIKVPSMLIQPLIENSFKHGLFHKPGNKKLSIHFYIEDNSLICKIEDNGIGRERANQIQKNQSFYKKSFSTKANEKRISLINDLLNSKISVDYIDKPDDSGTIVIVKIPF